MRTSRFYVRVEGRGRWNVDEGRGGRGEQGVELGENDYLGELAASDVVVRPEGVVRVARDHGVKYGGLYVRIEPIG